MAARPMDVKQSATIPYSKDTLIKQIKAAQALEARRKEAEAGSEEDDEAGQQPCVAAQAPRRSPSAPVGVSVYNRNSWAAQVVESQERGVPQHGGSHGTSPDQRPSSLPRNSSSPATPPYHGSSAPAARAFSSPATPPDGSAGGLKVQVLKKPDYNKTKSMWEAGIVKDKKPGEEVAKVRTWEVHGSGWEREEEDLRRDTSFVGDKERRVGRFVHGEWIAGQGNEIIDSFERARSGFQQKGPSAVSSARAAFEEKTSIGAQGKTRSQGSEGQSLIEQARAALKEKGLAAKYR